MLASESLATGVTASGAPAHQPANFDRVGRLYRWAEYLALGPFLQRTRTALLESLGSCRSALLLGDGDGRFTARMLARHTGMRATAVDTSAVMLGLLRVRAGRAGVSSRLRTVRESALDAVVPNGTDLIVTHFFLDGLTQSEVEHLVRRLALTGQCGMFWLVSDFSLPRNPVLRLAARLYIRGLYLAFRLLTGLRVQQLPDAQAALAAGGFRRLERREMLCGLLYSELWQLAPPTHDRHNPASAADIHPGMRLGENEAAPAMPGAPADPLPDPEPPVPSLPEPDPGVFQPVAKRPRGELSASASEKMDVTAV